MGAVIDLYFWKNRSNFGDQLALPLTQHFAGKEARWAAPPFARAVTVGSVLGHLPEQWPGVVCGAGALTEWEAERTFSTFVLGVRGELTAKAVGCRSDVALGDPGLLVSELYPVDTMRKAYDLGVIPHWTDGKLWDQMKAERALLGGKWSMLYIDPANAPVTVARMVASCKKVVSSSLHGVVFADAYGIPRRAERFPRMYSRYEGGEFKWHDYASVTGRGITFGKTIEVDRARIERAQQDMFEAFARMGKLFR